MPFRSRNRLHEILETRSRVTKSGCWIWTGPISNRGYGKMRYTENGYTISGAHRVTASLFFTQFKKTDCVCHKCDNKKCVNPSHLYLGTYETNNNDTTSRGRFTGRTQLTENTVKEIFRMRQEGIHANKIAERFNIHSSSVYRIANGTRRKLVTKHLLPLLNGQ